MKQFLEDVLAKMKAGENNEAMEMIEAKIAELDNQDEAMKAKGKPTGGGGGNGLPVGGKK